MEQLIYLDHAAATPMDPQVLAVMQPYFSDQFYNPSATYMSAKKVAQSLQEARDQIAVTLGARSTEIVFTAGGTEANNLAIQGVMQLHPKGNMVVSAIEHDSVLRPAAKYATRIARVDVKGSLNVGHLRELIDENTVLVSVMYANNEVGTIQPIRDIAQLIAGIKGERKKAGNTIPLYLHTDAAQAGNYLDLHVARLGVDLMTLNGGKIYGPKQSGVLFVKTGVVLRPLILGGGQERGLRSGTENVAAAIGFAKALALAQSIREQEGLRLQRLQVHFMDIATEQISNVVINGSQKKRLANNVHITIPGVDNERLLMQLDQQGILAAAGSACSASDEEPSHVLRAMGLSDTDAQSSLRFSMGRTTTESMIDQTIFTITRFLE